MNITCAKARPFEHEIGGTSPLHPGATTPNKGQSRRFG